MQSNQPRRQNCNYSLAVLAVVSAAVAGIYLLRRAKRRKISKTVADAGYETAYDIYFPLKNNRPGKF